MNNFKTNYMKKEYRLSDENLWGKIDKDFQNGGGIYKLFYKEDKEIRSIQRFLGVDKEGVLYIGKTNCYLHRVIELKKTIKPDMKSSSHICGRRYNKNDQVKKKFPYLNLFIELVGNVNPEKKERELLDEYFEKFGEVPPLNANG